MGDDFLTTLRKFIAITAEIIEELKKKRREMNKHHEKCNIGRAVGTTASVAGAGLIVGAVILAPFTAGASVLAAAGIGAAVGATGGLTNVAVDVIDACITKSELEKIERICARRQNVARRLGEYFEELQRLINHLKKKNVEDDVACSISLLQILKNGTRVVTSAKNLNALMKFVTVPKGIASASVHRGYRFCRSLGIQSQVLQKALAFAGINVSRNATMTVVRTGTIILNGAFIIWDVYSLVNNLVNKHCTISSISKIIDDLTEEVDEMHNIKEAATSLEDFNDSEDSNESEDCNDWEDCDDSEDCDD